MRYGPQELRDGVTTVRVLGERDFIDSVYKDAFDRDLVAGPRVLTSGPAVVASASSHGRNVGVVADGVDGVRTAVRTNVYRDAKVINFAVSLLTFPQTIGLFWSSGAVGRAVKWFVRLLPGANPYIRSATLS